MSLYGGKQRSSTTTAAQNQNLIDSSSINNKWLQPSSLQDYGIYGAGGGVQGSRIGRSVNEMVSDPSTPPIYPRPLSSRKIGGEDVSPNELSPGLLDLHSFDSELLPEISGPGLYDRSQYQEVGRKSFDDSESYLSANKLANKPRGLQEKTNNVAKIKVVVRKRPLNKREIAKKEEDIINIEPNSNLLTVHETKFKVDLTEYTEKHDFVFDAVLNKNVSNDEVYYETVQPIVPLIFQRTKATCFAYGQTGSGKTYTMQPLPLKASHDILRLMNYTYRNQGFQLFVSFFEIYGGKVYDLLNDRKKLCMREDGKQQVCIVGLEEYNVSEVETIKGLIVKGNLSRSTGTTGANEESSRSHAILQLAIKRSVDGSDSKPAKPAGKLSFIDLAGSERGADTTENDKQTRMEGAEINKSLLALKECIRALDNDQGHIPFRGSKLTEVLRDSFVGDSRTVMISCISPGSGSCEHTINTLRYADRVKSLSKGNISKKDLLSSKTRDSTVQESISNIPSDMNRSGSPPFNRIPGGRAEATLASYVHSNSYKGQRVGQNEYVEDDYFEGNYEHEKPSWTKNKQNESFPISALGNDNMRKIESKTKSSLNTENDLRALLQEENDLVTAHQRQVEETMDIVRVEMNLLDEADQPGNQLDGYISKLNYILSQKAAGIMQLQARLAHFQRHLNEHNVLTSSDY